MKKLKQFIGVLLLISMITGLIPSQSCNALAEDTIVEIPSGTKFKAMATGNGFSLGLKEDGTVVACGINDYDQCTVPEDLRNVKAIAAGYAHSLALKEDGTVVAWGDNSYYQCEVPDDLVKVKAISAGDEHSVALLEDGTVAVWGNSSRGQLSVPADLTNVKAISAGTYHTLALKEDGTVVAWGYNYYNQATVPEGLTDVIAVAAGYEHSLALKKDGTVVAWGYDDEVLDIPEDLTDVIAVDIHHLNCLALKKDGSVVAWGGLFESDYTVPEDLTDVKSIYAGWPCSMVIRQNGTVVALGTDTWGEGSFAETVAVKEISAGASNTLILKEDGTVAYLRKPSPEFLSPMSSEDYSVPTYLKNVTAIAAGSFHYLALKEDGTVVAWGSNSYNQCVVPSTLSKAVAVAAGAYHSVALLEDGTVVVWGDNSYQQCEIPEGLSNVKAIYASAYNTAAIKEDGTVVVWGPYGSDLLNIPEGLSNVKEIAIGNTHMLALKEDGTVTSWGSDDLSEDYSEEYIENHGYITIPEGLNDVKSIAAGNYYSIAVKSDGSVVLWGDYPSTAEYGYSQDVRNLKNVNKISAYDYYLTALTESGTLIDYTYGECSVYYFPPLSIKPDIVIGNINVSDNLISIQFAGSTLEDVSEDDFTITAVSTEVDGETVSEIVYGSIHSFNKVTNTVVLQVPEIVPSNSIKYTSYFVSYNGLVEAKTNEIITPPLASPLPSSTPLFTPEPTSYYTPVSSPYLSPYPTQDSSPDHTPNLTPVSTPNPSPSHTLRPTPSSTSIPSPAKTNRRSTPATPTITSPVETPPGLPPQQTDAIEPIDYDKVIDGFKNDVIERIKSFEGIEDDDNDKNELITQEVEKAIEKIAGIRINGESGSIEVEKKLISKQSELVLSAVKDITEFLETQPYEPNRSIRKIINIEVKLSSTELIIYLLKDVEFLEDLGIDIKISTEFGTIIIYHENLEALLSKGLTITMMEETPDPENTKIKSSIRLIFKYMDGTIIEKLDCKIGLELPYKDGNPDYCTIYHEVESNLSVEQKDIKYSGASESYIFNKQNQKTELGFPYRSKKPEYSAVNAKPNTKTYNLGGHEDTESKTLRISTASYGRYYVIEEKKTYDDISKEDPAAKEAIEVLSSKGIIHGKNNGSFDPDGELKRSEFVCLIVNVLNIIDEDASTDFVDVPLTAWYYNPVAIADTENLISGYPGNRFLGNNPINNQEIVKICASALQTEKGYSFPKDESNLLIYKDNKSIQEWARKYVSLGTREGLVVKRADGNFDAEIPCTRRDAALILYRLYKKL
ncbi:MAG: Endo-1,4-beta-xylanase A precursor [Firmicutes bacterium ADurb.Bin419]|nr:MAG: Endo-1,4-beta-xylanase A precursor [Firmicutes bacterium ADurb.Bin419]